jgi:ribosomal protein S4
MSSGAVKVNGMEVRDPRFVIKPGDTFSFGKKKHARTRLTRSE